MKRYFRKERGKLDTQAGVIITLFSITIPVLIGLVVLTVDCGALYLARSRLTKIARTSSATALNMWALRGWGLTVAEPPAATTPDLGLKTADVVITDTLPSTTTTQAILDEIYQSTVDGLKEYFPNDFARALNPYLLFINKTGPPASRPDLTVLNRKESSVNISLRYKTPTYFLGAISQAVGASNLCAKDSSDATLRCWVESVQNPGVPTGQFKEANVFMLLDLSGSMAEQVNGRAKSAGLVEAAANFIDMFNPYRDKFAVIPYATTADTGAAPSLALLDRSSENGYIKPKKDIERLAVGGQTNQCDALIQVIRAIEADTNLKKKTTPKFVLLFTDGAPNVYRLNFTDDPLLSKLDEALTAGGLASNNEAGWYGWTVKWGKRAVFHATDANLTCPTSDPDGGETAKGNNIPDCDPFWSFPRVVTDSSGGELSRTEVINHLRLSESGDFILKNAPYSGQTLGQLGYSLKFHTLSPSDYQASNAYQWHGPSYLVHSSFSIPRGTSLIDRIPTSLETPSNQAITCGPGSRNPFPGYQVSPSLTVADKYYHSRYFASRALDINWRWNATSTTESATDDSANKATKTGLSLDQLKTAPLYFDVRSHDLHGKPNDSPGCLKTLNSRIPFTTANINVGENFVSNDTAISTRGEAVKSAELPYYCALRAADWLRSQYNVIVFVVGLGPSATSIYGSNCEDPLQNALDPNSRKDFFLRRLAFAPESLQNLAAFIATDRSNSSWSSKSSFGMRDITLNSCTNHPLAGMTVNMGYGESDTNTSGFSPQAHGFTEEQLGAYYGSNDPSQLKLLFGNIAKRILIRLAT